MPEFILPAEADRCPHCGAVLRQPPACCQSMIAEYDAAERERWEREDREAARHQQTEEVLREMRSEPPY